MVQSKLAMFLVMAGLPVLLGSGVGPNGTASVRDMSLQVRALQTLNDLELTTRQLKAIRALAPAALAAAGNEPAQGEGKVPGKYVATLQALRDALLKNDETDQVDQLQDDLDEIVDEKDIEVDDGVTVTDAARAGVGPVMGMLTAKQVAGYLGVFEDDAPDPVGTLMETAGEVRESGQAEFDEIAGATGEDVGMWVAGIDPAKYGPVAARVKEWLKGCRAMSKAEFDGGQDELEKSATAMLGGTDGFAVLRHWMERDVSELLANPQLTVVLDARLQRAAAAK